MSKQSRIANPQRRIAAQILKCGESRVWMDPKSGMKIARAITRSDIRRLIHEGLISKIDMKVNNSDRTYKRQHSGSRKGAKGAREGKKDRWLRIIRPQRKMISELKVQMQPGAYRKLYSLVKGGAFRSRSHLQAYITDKKLMVEGKKK